MTRAASRCGLSTSAMSHALSRIRDQLQDPVLVRAGRGMVLSERAQALAPRVRILLEELSQVMAPAGELHPRELKRGFRIRATDHVLAVAGEAIDRRVASDAPGVDLQFLPNRSDDGEALRRGEADLAVGVYKQLPPELRIRDLFEDRFICVVRRDHPMKTSEFTLADYTSLDHILVAPRGRPGSRMGTLLRERGLSRRVARSVPYFLTALQWVSRSDYVLTVSEHLARQNAERFNLRLVKPPLAVEPYVLQMVWHPRQDDDPGHQWLRAVLVDAAGALNND